MKVKRGRGSIIYIEPTWKLEGTVEDTNQNVFLKQLIMEFLITHVIELKLDVEEYGQNKYGGGHHGGISVDSDGYSLCPIGGELMDY